VAVASPPGRVVVVVRRTRVPTRIFDGMFVVDVIVIISVPASAVKVSPYPRVLVVDCAVVVVTDVTR
jgi:hypothetical protein